MMFWAWACVADESSERGLPEVPAAEEARARPEMPFPPDAVDLDPEPGRVAYALGAQAAVHLVGDEEIVGYGYDGMAPGPTLRATVGDVLTLDLYNTLEVATTVHWHGMEVPAAMDGVELVQTPIPAGGAFTYTFPVRHAGTFWMHPHVDTDRQVDLGLYGVVVVDSPDEPPADDDVVLVFDAWDEAESGDGAADDHTPPDPRTVTWTVNGALDPRWSLSAGAAVRARLLNASNTSYLALRWPGVRRLGTDQGLWGAPGVVDDLVLAPGDRAEVEVLAGGGPLDVVTAPWSAAGGAAWGEPRRLFTVDGGTGTAPPLALVFSGAGPPPDPGRTDLLYVFQGGAPDTDWLINGEAWPEVTVPTVALGAELVVELRNLSATEHPFHVHGNRLAVVSVDGIAPDTLQVEDTVNVGIRSVVRLLMVPSEPGRWLAHCHLLSHEQGGMIAAIDVE